jgi:predicted RNA-binding protein YlxR (DUF448 family)
VRPRHIPLRRCVGCGIQLPQRELNRIVKTPGGDVEVDTAGKLPGRGAYLCSQPACWERGLQKSRVDHTLRIRLSDGDRQRLLEHARKRLQTD